MRHRRAKKALRYNMFNNMTISLITHGRIRTTLHKAKILRPFVEKIVTKAKNNPDSLAFRRSILSLIRNPDIAKTLLNDLIKIGAYFKDRNGGYTRIYKIGRRYGDCAEEAIIEFVDIENILQTKHTKNK